MIVAYTKLGPASDILIRENGKQYCVEIRRKLSVQHTASFDEDYESAEKYYDGLVEELCLE